MHTGWDTNMGPNNFVERTRKTAPLTQGVIKIHYFEEK
jgi:hypothetical protein